MAKRVKPVIYFCASIQGTPTEKDYREAWKDIYLPIIELLEGYGHVNDADIFRKVADRKIELEMDKKEIHDNCIRLVRESSIVVAEVTQASMGVGYEIGSAVAMGKKILCLYRPNFNTQTSLSAMIRGAANNDNFIVKDYDVVGKDLPDIFDDLFRSD